MRLLGLVLGRKLTWVSYMKHLRDSCMKRLNVIKVLARVSYGIIANNATIKLSIAKPGSIFTAEAYAILDALKYAGTHNFKNIAIYSDSISVINALTKPNNKNSHEIITEVLEAYKELNNDNNTEVYIIWTPSHQGITGNEDADRAAKEVTTLPPAEATTPIPHQDLISHIKSTLKEKWNKIWTPMKRTKIHNVIQNFYQPIPLCGLNRKEKSIMFRLRTGHTKITHEHLVKKTEQPYCIYCPNEILTVEYILYQCGKTELQRQKYDIKPNTALTAQDHIRGTINFLKATNMYDKI
ncbi:PREDICTED: uncharacterized protein LOC107186184 [Dufourea novaeangliae]|uniref:uncharacterized protein LOC107186184 n=1 Tax=Dufourea novaeangliae TaxID=178035 RepID=UPI0007670690|nr:PREDICTED: uncharacterized protein LOC107186184 [Dufourea novaeangliae]